MEKKIITEILRIKQIMNKNLLFEGVPPLSVINKLIKALNDGVGGTFDNFASAITVAEKTAAGKWTVILNFAKNSPAFFTKLSTILYRGLDAKVVDAIQKTKDDILAQFAINPELDRATLKNTINNAWEQELGTSTALDVIKMDFAKLIDEFRPPINPPPVIPIIPLKHSYKWFNAYRLFLLQSIKQTLNKDFIDINNLLKIIKESDDVVQQQLALREISVHYMAIKKTPEKLRLMLEKFMRENNISDELSSKIIGRKIIDPTTGVVTYAKEGGDDILKAIMSGKYDPIGSTGWAKINDGIFRPLREAMIGGEGALYSRKRWSVAAGRWFNYIKWSTFKSDDEILKLAASRTLGERITSIIYGVIIQNFIIIPSIIAIVKTFKQGFSTSGQKALLELKKEFIKNCKKENYDDKTIKTLGTCEQQAELIFENKVPVEPEKDYVKSLWNNFKTSIPIGVETNNPYNMNIIPDDYKKGAIFLQTIGAFTNIDDLLAGTFNTSQEFYNRLIRDTESEQKSATERVKCFKHLEGFKEMLNDKKQLALVNFEKCIGKTLPNKNNLTPKDDPQPVKTTPGAYTNDKTSFIQYLKTINKEYEEGSYSEDGKGGQDNKGEWYMFKATPPGTDKGNFEPIK